MIRIKNVPVCPLCTSPGTQVYTGLTDELYAVEGMWSMKKCSNQNCRSLWLDPAPIDTELGKLYASYTTHDNHRNHNQTTRRISRTIFDAMRESVLTQELGYTTDLPIYMRRFLDLISRIHPGWRDEKLNQVFYVPFTTNGTLLDVGCGAGQAMETLEGYGWKTTGTDFDAQAVANARSKGLDVRLGELENLHFKKESFDVILLSHVIEHVPKPAELIRECYRLLRPSGHLIVITPNADSRGHKKFQQHWRGLEIPRHLHIFTSASLEHIGRQAGFRSITGRTCMQGLGYIWEASRAHASMGSFELGPKNRTIRILDKIKTFWFGYLFRLFPGREETILLHCQK